MVLFSIIISVRALLRPLMQIIKKSGVCLTFLPHLIKFCKAIYAVLFSLSEGIMQFDERHVT